MTRPMLKLLLVMSAIMVLTLITGIIWASLDSNPVDGLRFLAGNRWGIVTLLDVCAGVLAMAIWIWHCDQRMKTWLVWVVAMLILGHLVSLAYLVIRAARERDLTELDVARKRVSQ